MKTKITTVHQRGLGFVWAVQTPNAVIFTKDGSLESAEKKLEQIKKAS